MKKKYDNSVQTTYTYSDHEQNNRNVSEGSELNCKGDAKELHTHCVKDGWVEKRTGGQTILILEKISVHGIYIKLMCSSYIANRDRFTLKMQI